MKRILVLIALIIASVSGFAQTPAPIVGSSLVCLGSPTLLTDATTGGTWSSSNTAVAVVGGTTGVVLGVSVGSAVITYNTSTGFVTKLMSVKALPTIVPGSVSGCVNSSYQMSGVPAGGSWGIGSTTIATINFVGVVTGVSPGVTNITYTEAGGCAATAPMTVNPVPLPITGTNFVYSGLTTSLTDMTPGGTWSSSNPALATVGAGTGIVTGVSAGLVLISYTLPTSCAAFYRVEVNPLPAIASLYAWYPFCGDTTDKSGNGRDLINHGITTTPATLTTDRFGNADNAYLFNGTTSMMNYTTFFPNSGTPNDFTYSCWINIPANQSSIVWYNGTPGLNGFGMVINNGTLGTPGNQVGIVFGASPTVNGSQPISLGTWHNLVLVKNGGVYNFYIDNAPGVFFLETTAPVFTGVFAMGMNYPSSTGAGPLTDAFNGSMDDLVYITRQLSAAERLSLFNFNPDAKIFALGNDTTICSDRLDLIPAPQTVGARYEWSRFNGLGYTVLDTVDTVYTVYPVSGPFGNEYVLKISKPYGCVRSDTIVVFKAPIPVNLGPDQHVCIGDTITLADFFPSANFLWSTGETAHSIDVTTTGTYYVTVDSIYLGSTCVGRDTINVNFHPVPIIGLPDNVKHCAGDPDTLRPHKDPVYAYYWSNGTNGDSLVVTTSGTYWVIVSDSGCTRTDTSNVLIVFDTVTFNLNDSAVCKGHPYPTVGKVTFNPIVTYQWTPTAGIALPNSPTPIIRADTSADYIVTVSYPGCPDITDTFHLDVQPNPTVFIGGNRHVCEGDTIHVDALVSPEWYDKYIFKWSPAGALDCSTCSTVVLTGVDTLNLYLDVVTPAWTTTLTPGYCATKDSATIFTHPKYFDSVVTQHSLCPGDSVQLQTFLSQNGIDHNVVIVNNYWTPGIYLDDSMSSAPWVHPLTSVGYRLVAVSDWGCRDTLTVDIEVHAAGVIEMIDSVVIYPGESYHIQPQTNCTHFTWFPPLGLDNVNVADPVARPDVNTVYVVEGQTEFGCKVTDSFKVRVDPNSILAMPNAFAPNSFNNKFMPLKRGIVELTYFRVFDRWGVKMFETKDINEGWDGTYKGKPQPFGVYVYELEAMTNTGKIINRRGNVTLIK